MAKAADSKAGMDGNAPDAAFLRATNNFCAGLAAPEPTRLTAFGPTFG